MRFWTWINQWKHLILLLSLIVLIFTQPAAQHSEAAEIAYSVVFSIATLVIFLAVFDTKWRRIVALCLASPTLIVHWLVRALSWQEQLAAVAIEHAATALFLSFAVTIILRDIFESERIDADHILVPSAATCWPESPGAICISWSKRSLPDHSPFPPTWPISSSTKHPSVIFWTTSASSRSPATATAS